MLINYLAQIIFWVSVLAIFHSYVIYPLLLKLLSRGKSLSDEFYNQQDEWPTLIILMAAYNEEEVIKEKLESIFNTEYPLEKIKVWIGSDGSVDRTDEIIATYANRYRQCELTRFGGRNGKSNILNQLVLKKASFLQKHPDSVFIMTDANVIFTPALLHKLARHFKSEEIGIVGATIVNRGMRKDGISVQEKSYIQRENLIKYREGLLWGSMMGAFGACYAMRTPLFTQIPANFLMEDFYLSMNVLDLGKKAIKDIEAIAYEDVSNDIQEEFKRKKRISSGNFQNLSVYKHLLNPSKGGLAFSFFSHKLLRWLGPIFIMCAFISGLFLAIGNQFYCILFILQAALLSIPVLDALLKKLGLHIGLFRYITYFYYMNYALLIGLINYIKGINTNVWTPTQRNQ